jgi:hypothetical protein
MAMTGRRGNSAEFFIDFLGQADTIGRMLADLRSPQTGPPQ